MKNGHSKEIFNIGYTRHKTKTNKAIRKHRKHRKDKQQKPGVNRGAREWQAVSASYETTAILLI